MSDDPWDPHEQLERELELRIDRLRFLSAELVAVRRDLDRCRLAADRARERAARLDADLRRLRRRRTVRILQRVTDATRRINATVRRPARSAVPRAGSQTQGHEPAPGAEVGLGPAASRARLRARVRPAGGGGGMRLRPLWPADAQGYPDLPEPQVLHAAMARVAWEVATDDDSADAVLSFDPAADVRAIPEGVLRLAWVSAGRAQEWLASEWFDEFDLVFAPPDALAAVSTDSVHLPVATAGATDPDIGVTVRDAVLAWLEAVHVDIAIGPRGWDAAVVWGDYYFGRSLQRALIRHGIAARIRLRDAWDGPSAGHADAVVHLFGMSRRMLRADQVNVLWVISHPDLVTDDMLAEHDLVFAASDRLAAALAGRSGRPVIPLHQATDPDRFHPAPGGPDHDLLFVAGYRSTRRPVVDQLAPTPLDLAVYGRGWTTDVLDARHHAGDYVPNRRLASYYSAAKIVLNDHWADMADWSVFSNRLYDAAACGAFVLSDHVEGIEDEFDGGIATFRSGAELRQLVRRYLADPDERAAMARRAQSAVLAHHSFTRRAEVLVAALEPLVRDRRQAPANPDA